LARLLALDVDGTLLRSDNTLSDRNRQAVGAARRAGWTVVLATGKPPWAIERLAETLELPGPHVVANGCGLWSAGAGLELLAQIPADGVATALAFATSRNLPRAVSGPRGVFCEPHWRVAEVQAALEDVAEEPPTQVADARAAEPQPWKVILIVPMRDPNPEAPAVHGGQWVRTHPRFFETLPAHASKAEAVRRLCGRMGIDRQDVVAIGDSENDVELLRWSGCGVAMAHAPAHVRQAATRTTAGNNEDGVAVALDAILPEWSDGAG
jgi:hypothetical protein